MTLLVAEGIHKRYGGVHALRGASLEVHAGEVHALIGENGSGKSTLLRILSGQLQRDAGEIVFDGSRIATVTQETTLAPDLSIAENVFLGHRMARRGALIDWRATRRRARDVLARLELDLDPATIVRRLRPDQQQLVEIARALSMDARVVVLDEPTSSLTDDEVEALFAVVRRLRDDGVAVIFVSHRLNEVLAIADRLTILRVRGASLRRAFADVDLDVAPGEVVGLAGLVGAGRSELLEALFGLRRLEGTVEYDGRPVAYRSPYDAIRDGIAFVPADRKQQGLVLTMSVRENLMMATTARRLRLRRPNASRELTAVRGLVRGLDIRVPSPDAPAATLSGGNQQKVVLGKWLAASPKLLMLDEPTRGVDVGAKAEIYRLLTDVAQRGIAVLISSSETPELRTLCDRIVVMFRGRVVASLAKEEATEARIAHFAGGHA